MLTTTRAGYDWFNRLRTAGSTAPTRVGVVVNATMTGLRTGGFASSAPAALSDRSSGYCDRCTWAPLTSLRCGRLSRIARIQGGTSLLAHEVAMRAVRARVRRIFKLRNCALGCSGYTAATGGLRSKGLEAVVLFLAVPDQINGADWS